MKTFVTLLFLLFTIRSTKAQLPPDTVPRPHDTIPYAWRDTSGTLRSKKQQTIYPKGNTQKDQRKKEEKNSEMENPNSNDGKKKKQK